MASGWSSVLCAISPSSPSKPRSTEGNVLVLDCLPPSMCSGDPLGAFMQRSAGGLRAQAAADVGERLGSDFEASFRKQLGDAPQKLVGDQVAQPQPRSVGSLRTAGSVPDCVQRPPAHPVPQHHFLVISSSMVFRPKGVFFVTWCCLPGSLGSLECWMATAACGTKWGTVTNTYHVQLDISGRRSAVGAGGGG